MFDKFFLLIIGLFFGTGLGWLIATAPAEGSGSDHHAPGTNMDHHAGETAMAMAPRDVSGEARLPGLTASLTKDTGGNFNLNIALENFRFAPDNVNGAYQPGDGHAHLYVNGVKRARLYGAWYHLDDLPAGDVQIRISLNGNDHLPLSNGTSPIEATLNIPPR
jgi:hypothetical protein